MTKYVLKRLVYMVIVFLLVSLLMYSIYNLIPTDPARAQLEPMKTTLKPEEYEQRYQMLRQQMGLDDPLIVRYLRWIGFWPDVNGELNGMLQGNFGYSQIYKTDVANVLPSRMLNTIYINIFSTLVALAITIPLGIYCAVHKRSKSDNAVQVLSIVGYSIPGLNPHCTDFYLAVRGHAPLAAGLRHADAGQDLYRLPCVPRQGLLYDAAGARHDGRLARRHDPLRPRRHDRSAQHGLYPHRPCQGPARKGRRLFPRMAQRAAAGHYRPHRLVHQHLSPGSLIIEQMFALNGMGQLYYQGLMNNDFELALAIQMFDALIALVGQLITDLSYGIVDPRVRVNK